MLCNFFFEKKNVINLQFFYFMRLSEVQISSLCMCPKWRRVDKYVIWFHDDFDSMSFRGFIRPYSKVNHSNFIQVNVFLTTTTRKKCWFFCEFDDEFVLCGIVRVSAFFLSNGAIPNLRKSCEQFQLVPIFFLVISKFLRLFVMMLREARLAIISSSSCVYGLTIQFMQNDGTYNS